VLHNGRCTVRLLTGREVPSIPPDIFCNPSGHKAVLVSSLRCRICPKILIGRSSGPDRGPINYCFVRRPAVWRRRQYILKRRQALAQGRQRGLPRTPCIHAISQTWLSSHRQKSFDDPLHCHHGQPYLESTPRLGRHIFRSFRT
jgi:hypothetical protein